MIQPKIIKGASWATPVNRLLDGKAYLRCACKSWNTAKGSIDTLSFRIIKRIRS